MNGKAKRKFSDKEDKELKKLVHQLGEDWAEISELMPGRNIRQIKDRWNNYLSPKVNRSPYTKEEDDLILKMYKELGPRWVQICKLLVGRTDISVKNRWTTLTKNSEQDIELPSPGVFVTAISSEIESKVVDLPKLEVKVDTKDDDISILWNYLFDIEDQTSIFPLKLDFFDLL